MKKILLILLCVLLTFGLIWPEAKQIPVQGATKQSWNANTFWYEPWGKSGVHKGIDIFADKGTPVLSTTSGIVIYAGSIDRGGRVVVILGPKWRLHYYAHLQDFKISSFKMVQSGSPIGTVGQTGNAKNRPAHLHYSIVRLIPVPWAMDTSTQGYKKAFYINPIVYLTQP